MRNPFKACVIAITGDFGPRRTLDKIKQWVQVNGGTYASEIDDRVTHLVCSKKHFKENQGLVRAAREHKSIQIVSFDWLEDTLIRMYPRKEREYLMSVTGKARKDHKKKKAAVREQNIKKGMDIFEKTCKEFEAEMNSSNYHVYHDYTGFRYDVTLARADLLQNQNERYMLKVCEPRLHHPRVIISTPIFASIPLPFRPRAWVRRPRAQRLQLYETHTTPKLYACFERYSKPGATSTSSIIAPLASSFDVAFDNFKKFFQLKTGKSWDDRLQKTKLSEEDFVYVQPKEGEPKGIMLSDTHEENNMADCGQATTNAISELKIEDKKLDSDLSSAKDTIHRTVGVVE